MLISFKVVAAEGHIFRNQLACSKFSVFKHYRTLYWLCVNVFRNFCYTFSHVHCIAQQGAFCDAVVFKNGRNSSLVLEIKYIGLFSKCLSEQLVSTAGFEENALGSRSLHPGIFQWLQPDTVERERNSSRIFCNVLVAGLKMK